jgi:hypothetical protein
MCYYSNPYGSVVGGALRQFNAIFLNASIVAFGDDIKKHFSPHDFRDVISTVLENPKVKANVNLAKPLTSHKPSGIEATYANHPDSDYLELFKMCLPYLIPETTGELKVELNKQKEELDKVKEQNEKRIKFLEQRLLDNGLSINKMMTDFSQLKATFEELQKLKAEEEHNKPEKVKFD